MDALALKKESYGHQLMRTGNVPGPPQEVSLERNPWLPADKRALIVDVGCAWGTMLLALRQHGYTNLMGVELDEGLAAEARNRCAGFGEAIRIVRANAIEYFEGTNLLADRVTLFHVLEHFSPKDGARLVTAIMARLHPDHGRLVVEVPNMSSITGTNMQCSDLTHATAFTEYSLKQLLEGAGFTRVSVVCIPPPLRLWRVGRQGSGLGWHANRGLHSFLYKVTNSGPRPTCYCPALMMTAAR